MTGSKKDFPKHTVASIAECLIDRQGALKFDIRHLNYLHQQGPYWSIPESFMKDENLLFLDRIVYTLLFHYKKEDEDTCLTMELIQQIIARIGRHPDDQENAIWHYEKEQDVILHPVRYEEFKRPLVDLDVILSFCYLWKHGYISISEEETKGPC